jgi:RNA polymerase sporulation-specific sigma factor
MSATHARGRPADTPLWERRLIRAAGRGDRAAQALLLKHYEAMVRHIVRPLHVAGGEREDLAQEARIGVFDAARCWDPQRRVPFHCFAWLCANHEVISALNAARARKHEPLNGASSLERTPDGEYRESGPSEQWVMRDRAVELEIRLDDHPVKKMIAREQLQGILERVPTLTELERRVLAGSANDHTHRDIARQLGIRPRAVNNALQRARHKLLDPARV